MYRKQTWDWNIDHFLTSFKLWSNADESGLLSGSFRVTIMVGLTCWPKKFKIMQMPLKLFVNVAVVVVIRRDRGDTLNYFINFHDSDDHTAYRLVWRQGASLSSHCHLLCWQTERFGAQIFTPFNHLLLKSQSPLHSPGCSSNPWHLQTRPLAKSHLMKLSVPEAYYTLYETCFVTRT